MHLNAETTGQVESVRSAAVYDDSGTIVYVHTVVTMAGGATTTDEALAARALELAARRGVSGQLATLVVDAADIEPRTRYRVDTGAKKLLKADS